MNITNDPTNNGSPTYQYDERSNAKPTTVVHPKTTIAMMAMGDKLNRPAFSYSRRAFSS